MPTPGGLRPSNPAATRLADLAAGLPISITGSREQTVTGVTLDSRQVRPGDLYAALPGSRAHGATFAAAAVGAGAAAVLTDQGGADLCAAAGSAAGVPVLVAAAPRAVLGVVAARVYQEPATRLRPFGITGTNGKTTTAYLIDAGLAGLGLRTGLLGTIEAKVAGERFPSERTTPEAPQVQALLALMVERQVAACVMEVSSHALDQHRVDGVRFDVAGFTNLSQDHLDYHPSMADYFAAKARLFTPEHARRGVVCVDDEWGRRLARTAGVPVTSVATADPTGGARADWSVADLRPDAASTAFTLLGPGGQRISARCPLPGRFNVANTALALVMLAEAGLDAAAAAPAIASASVPGRMERVTAPAAGAASLGEAGSLGGAGPLGIVDYAHTPQAVLLAVQALSAGPRPLVVVLGAGGDRDRDKRPQMGAAAARHADVVIVTDDNPRSEDPAQIRAAVLTGARGAGPPVSGGAPAAGSGAPRGAEGHRPEVLEVADRRRAIREAVRRATQSPSRPGTVLIVGKGHEQGQDVGGAVLPFDDRAELRAALIQTLEETTR